jgi:hypothetical protein
MISLQRLIREHWQIAVIVGIFLCAESLFIISTYHMPSWDEAVYLGMGKHIYSAGQIGLWEDIRPIGWPLLTGLAWKSGLDQMAVSAAFMLAFSVGSIILTYLIGKRAFGKRSALISCILMSSTSVFFIHATYFFTELPSMFFVLLTILFFMESQYFRAGFTGGLAFLFKFPQGIVLMIMGIAVIVSYVLSKKRSRAMLLRPLALLVTGSILVILPFLVFNFIIYSGHSSAFDAVFMPLVRAAGHQGNIYQSVFYFLGSYGWWAQLVNIFYYPLVLIKQQFAILLSFAALAILASAKRYLNPERRLIAITFIVYLVYLTQMLNKQERFLPMLLPFACILAAGVIGDEYPGKRHPGLGTKAILFVVLAASVLIGAYVIHGEWRALPSGEPPIAQFYRSFANTSITGPIQTTDPVFSAYTDRKYIPIYDTMDPGTLFVNRWQQAEPTDAVIYCESAFPCFAVDTECEELRTQKFVQITRNRTLIRNVTYEDVTFLVYVNVPTETSD